MSGSSKYKETSRNGSEDDCNRVEGSAARTRPLSFDEIMSKRKLKNLSRIENAGALEDSGNHIVQEVSKSERGNRHEKDSYHSGQKHVLEEHVEGGSSRKGQENDDYSAKDGNLSKGKGREFNSGKDKYVTRGKDREFNSGKDKYVTKGKDRDFSLGKDEYLNKGKGREFRDSEARLKSEMGKDLRAGAKEKGNETDHPRRKSDMWPRNDSNDAKKHSSSREMTENEGRVQKSKLKSVIERNVKVKTDKTPSGKRKTDGRPSNASENEVGKRMSRDFGRKNGRADGSREKFSVENKREYHNEVEEKNRGKNGRADESREKFSAENKRDYRNEIEDKNRDKNETKKRDAGKGHDLETSEQKRKELSKSRYEEERPKRRRSRSGEREGKSRRSISPSPRANKRASYHGREHRELPSSGRQHSDIGRSKLVDDGSSSHHRRNGGSASGLGGYSPRKRRTQAAIKTPSPPRRSPEKKSAKWDLAPEGKGTTFAASVPISFQSANQTAVSNITEVLSAFPIAASNIMKALSVVAPSASSTNKIASLDSIQLTQATRPMRRLYVENLPTSASESTLMEFLNSCLVSSGVNRIQGTQPCISCVIHKEKSQALVEFLTPEDASAALSFDGSSFSHSIIKIRRPKDFVEMATGELEKSMAAVESISDIVQDSPNKIFVGGISKALSSKMFMEIASGFGPLKAYQFDSRDDFNGSYAFLEYADKSVTLKACVGLNGMKLGGRVITAVQAVPNTSSLESIENPPFHGIPEQAKPLLEKPTQVLKLKNVFDLEALSSLSPTEIEEVLEDVRFECARFGAVKSVNVVKYSASPISVSEPCVIDGDMASAGTRQNFGDYQTNSSEEPARDAMDNKTAEGCNDDEKSANDLMEDEPYRLEIMDHGIVEGISIQDEKYAGVDMEDEQCRQHIKEGGSADDDDKYAGGLVEDESCQAGHLDRDKAAEDFACMSGSNPEELPQPYRSKDELDCLDDKDTDSIHDKDTSPANKSMGGEQLNLEGGNGEVKSAFVADSMAAVSDAVEKGEDKEYDNDLGQIFELGSIFVEFGRTEASSMAAHCLHGRLFDDRIVAVRYVPLDIYRSRFPK